MLSCGREADGELVLGLVAAACEFAGLTLDDCEVHDGDGEINDGINTQYSMNNKCLHNLRPVIFL